MRAPPCVGGHKGLMPAYNEARQKFEIDVLEGTL